MTDAQLAEESHKDAGLSQNTHGALNYEAGFCAGRESLRAELALSDEEAKNVRLIGELQAFTPNIKEKLLLSIISRLTTQSTEKK